MALVDVEGMVWRPILCGSLGISSVTYVLDADGEYAALICRAPRTGNIDRFDFNIGTVGNSPDNGLRASLQSVDADGLKSGTILGATNGAHVTYAHTVTTGWKSTNFGEVAAVTKGQAIACVVDIPTFTASDSVTLSRQVVDTGFPYGVAVLGTKQHTGLPVMALHYTDGYARLGYPGPFGFNTHTSVSYNLDTGTADEWGLAFELEAAARLEHVGGLWSCTAGGNYEITVYDSASSPLSTIAVDGDLHPSAQAQNIALSTAVDLAANTLYRVTLRPTTTTNIALHYVGFASLDLMDTFAGPNFYMTSRLDQAGAWTNYNSGTFRTPRISLGLTALEGGGSTGGGRLAGAGGLVSA